MAVGMRLSSSRICPFCGAGKRRERGAGGRHGMRRWTQGAQASGGPRAAREGAPAHRVRLVQRPPARGPNQVIYLRLGLEEVEVHDEAEDDKDGGEGPDAVPKDAARAGGALDAAPGDGGTHERRRGGAATRRGDADDGPARAQCRTGRHSMRPLVPPLMHQVRDFKDHDEQDWELEGSGGRARDASTGGCEPRAPIAQRPAASPPDSL